MADAIDGGLPVNNGSSVESAPGAGDVSPVMGYRGPGIVGNDNGGDGSKRNTNDPNDDAGSKRYKNDPKRETDTLYNRSEIILVTTRRAMMT